jgi:hypothetical protein
MEQRLLQKKIRKNSHLRPCNNKGSQIKINDGLQGPLYCHEPPGASTAILEPQAALSRGHKILPAIELAVLSHTNHTNTLGPLTAHEGSRGISEEYSTTKEEDNHMSHHRQTGVSS